MLPTILSISSKPFSFLYATHLCLLLVQTASDLYLKKYKSFCYLLLSFKPFFLCLCGNKMEYLVNLCSTCLSLWLDRPGFIVSIHLNCMRKQSMNILLLSSTYGSYGLETFVYFIIVNKTHYRCGEYNYF